LNIYAYIIKMFSRLQKIVACFFIDIVGTCIFGIKCNSILDPDVEFRKVSRAMTELNFIRAMKEMAIFFVPEVKYFYFGQEHTLIYIVFLLSLHTT
jgi:hypothetical protein